MFSPKIVLQNIKTSIKSILHIEKEKSTVTFMEKNTIQTILSFDNQRVDSSIINHKQIEALVTHLYHTIHENIEGDVVELGCYVGESSKYLQKTLDVTDCSKQLYVYDSFEGLPELSEHEKNTGWRPNTLKTSQDVLVQNF